MEFIELFILVKALRLLIVFNALRLLIELIESKDKLTFISLPDNIIDSVECSEFRVWSIEEESIIIEELCDICMKQEEKEFYFQKGGCQKINKRERRE